MEKYFLILITSFIAIEFIGGNPSSENENTFKVNQLDSLGRKTSFWFECKGWLTHYDKNKNDGPSICFSNQNYDDMTMLINYTNNSLSGSMMSFYPDGVVHQLLVNITPNVDFIGAQRTFTQNAKFPYQTYCYDFYPDGKLKAKGWAIICEDFLIDSGERVGIWQYYTPDGKEENVDFSNENVDYSPLL